MQLASWRNEWLPGRRIQRSWRKSARRLPASGMRLGLRPCECRRHRQARAGKQALSHFFALHFVHMTHWGLSPRPSTCTADVIPLHHVPLVKLRPRMRCSLQVLWTQKLADVRSFGFRGAIRRIFLFFANEKTRKTTLFVACVEHVQTVLAQDHCSSDDLSEQLTHKDIVEALIMLPRDGLWPSMN